MAEARSRLSEGLETARGHGESVVRIIHGQGKHSDRFPVIKSYVRRWLEESDFSRLRIEVVYPGEDGSPYTRPNAGETVVILRASGQERGLPIAPVIEDEQEAFEARKHAKGIRADRLRTMRRRGPR